MRPEEYIRLPKWRLYLPTILYVLGMATALLAYAGMSAQIISDSKKIKQCQAHMREHQTPGK